MFPLILNIRRLLPDDETGLKIMSHFGIKLCMLVKIAESNKLD